LTNRYLWQALGCFFWLLSLFRYLDIQAADQQAIEKFGEPYKEYMKNVPQVNFIAGIMKNFRR
jgi:protein-S-isoprenylcysteine O-methyltransferase Ste14